MIIFLIIFWGAVAEAVSHVRKVNGGWSEWRAVSEFITIAAVGLFGSVALLGL